jgi:hypothetical protein
MADLCLPPAFTLVSYSAYFSTLKMEAICSSETSVYFQWTTRRYILIHELFTRNGIRHWKLLSRLNPFPQFALRPVSMHSIAYSLFHRNALYNIFIRFFVDYLALYMIRLPAKVFLRWLQHHVLQLVIRFYSESVIAFIKVPS